MRPRPPPPAGACPAAAAPAAACGMVCPAAPCKQSASLLTLLQHPLAGGGRPGPQVPLCRGAPAPPALSLLRARHAPAALPAAAPAPPHLPPALPRRPCPTTRPRGASTAGRWARWPPRTWRSPPPTAARRAAGAWRARCGRAWACAMRRRRLRAARCRSPRTMRPLRRAPSWHNSATQQQPTHTSTPAAAGGKEERAQGVGRHLAGGQRPAGLQRLQREGEGGGQREAPHRPWRRRRRCAAGAETQRRRRCQQPTVQPPNRPLAHARRAA